MNSDIESAYCYFKLYNANGFGNKSLKIVLDSLNNSNFNIVDLFNFSKADFEHTFPNLGKGRLKSASYESLKSINEDKLFADFELLQSTGIDIVSIVDKEYPKRVKQKMQDSSPPILFSKGHKSLYNSEGFAIIGSRNATLKGLDLAKKIAERLSKEGYNIISGYAKGIDTRSHLGALENGGTTSIVLSYGIYELLKSKTLEQINWATNTLAISQFDLHEKWRASNAMIRNKLVCSLAKGVIVIETGKERDKNGKMSGTFDAARSAIQMGIPVFVVSPDKFENAVPEGNLDLIKLGGIEVGSLGEILKYCNTNASNQINRNNLNSSQIKLF